MTLHLIGIGIDNEKDITLKGLERVKASEYVFLEDYTSILNIDISRLTELYGKEIIRADRNLVENRAEEEILEKAKNKDVAFLVVGDIFGATTHADLLMRAKEMNIRCTITHNTSIINAVSETGLELYKFGKTTSIPFPEGSHRPSTAYDVIASNLKNGLHTLALLDIKRDEDKYMTVGEAIRILLDIEEEKKKRIFTEDTLCVGCARIGSDTAKISFGKAKELIEEDFGEPLHCLIIPGKMHFMEEDMLKTWR